MKTLIHDDVRFHNQRLVVPIDGLIQLGPKGHVEVSDAAAKVLLTIPHWRDPEAVVEDEQTAEKDENGAVESQLHFDENSDNSGLQGIDLDDLGKLEPAELLEIAAAAGIEVPEKMQAKKTSLVTYVRNQIKKLLTPNG